MTRTEVAKDAERCGYREVYVTSGWISLNEWVKASPEDNDHYTGFNFLGGYLPQVWCYDREDNFRFAGEWEVR